MRLKSLWQQKVALGLALGTAFLVPYLLLQRVQIGVSWTPPRLSLDRVIPFDLHWTWVYQSVHVPFALVPWLSWRPDQLRRYARGYLLVLAVSFLIFAAFPAQGPARDISGATGLYVLMCTIDTRGNAFPSLHAGLIACLLLFARRLSLGSTSLVVLARAGLAHRPGLRAGARLPRAGG